MECMECISILYLFFPLLRLKQATDNHVDCLGQVLCLFNSCWRAWPLACGWQKRQLRADVKHAWFRRLKPYPCCVCLLFFSFRHQSIWSWHTLVSFDFRLPPSFPFIYSLFVYRFLYYMLVFLDFSAGPMPTDMQICVYKSNLIGVMWRNSKKKTVTAIWWRWCVKNGAQLDLPVRFVSSSSCLQLFLHLFFISPHFFFHHLHILWLLWWERNTRRGFMLLPLFFVSLYRSSKLKEAYNTAFLYWARYDTGKRSRFGSDSSKEKRMNDKSLESKSWSHLSVTRSIIKGSQAWVIRRWCWRKRNKKKKRSLRKYPDGRSWETPSFSYTTCICPLCVCCAKVPVTMSRHWWIEPDSAEIFFFDPSIFLPFFFIFRLLLNFKEKVHSFISSSFIFFFLILVASLSARPSRIFCPVSFWKDNFSLTLSKSQSLTFFSLNFSTYFLPFFHF